MKTAFTIGSPASTYLADMGQELIDRDPERAAVAHLLRRSAMCAHPARIEALTDRSWSDAVDDVLTSSITTGTEPPPISDDWGDTVGWWVDRMVAEDTGLVDRMTWFWHGLLTTNAYKVSESSLIGTQLAVVRGNALGNFRQLLQEFVVSGALLEYLDASWSMASNPNENLARELMELFTIGRGHYSQDDVRAAARALAGWVVEDGVVEFRRENSFRAPLIFLGQQADWDTASLVDRLCDHPATAARIGARLWSQLVGVPLTPDAASELGSWWQERDLEIMPLVERILRDPAFAASTMVRPRSAIEWFCALRAATGLDGSESWYLDSLGQMPFLPPNVAGWPDGDRWLSAGSLLGRASVVHGLDLAALVGDGSTVDVNRLLDACGLWSVSASTRQALDGVAGTAELSPEGAHLARWRLVLTCPEFHLS
jgi:uncharacterized protein (DUF1800 family)